MEWGRKNKFYYIKNGKLDSLVQFLAYKDF
jgi:hypothetical protein